MGKPNDEKDEEIHWEGIEEIIDNILDEMSDEIDATYLDPEEDDGDIDESEEDKSEEK